MDKYRKKIAKNPEKDLLKSLRNAHYGCKAVTECRSSYPGPCYGPDGCPMVEYFLNVRAKPPI